MGLTLLMCTKIYNLHVDAVKIELKLKKKLEAI